LRREKGDGAAVEKGLESAGRDPILVQKEHWGISLQQALGMGFFQVWKEPLIASYAELVACAVPAACTELVEVR
jgi:hypothetical protein